MDSSFALSLLELLFTAKHLTVFGLFRIALSKRRDEKKCDHISCLENLQPSTDLVDVLLEEVRSQVLELRLFGAVVRVDRPRTPNLLKRKIPAGIGGQRYLVRERR